jgi:hypothetical protein
MKIVGCTKLVVSTLVATMILLGGITNAQTIYEWRGDGGERSYSDTPPENVELESTGIEISPTNPSAVKARESAKREAAVEQAEVDQLNAAKAANDAQIAAKEKEQSEANCAQARKKVRDYQGQGPRRIYRTGPDGELEYMGRADEERAKAQNEVDTYCK